ncbi:hypothetical protein [Rhodospirillum rubrum]|uniref:Uncharacterized protein n=1 Tax=Rhodospirillum rubrum (strain ATCC 11170 / ATH 1.1.1 / DSM 467 / LMG 4362 / NCIMB 8255 / S1) TaxID=269796 RepID=Q2RTX7_RHORT|nr:hypothetical protein [Rhodospirillum rubrum]ABC22418.1 hypothetical protein Rru_A1618 [Rhodospirillum rubrum ATCC 11170]MBK5953999.1 hypothetical protein [Rhodospirillum rubrum]QXG82054.1 hypothetical protein KUL73_08375 [Rhodospirillum rubrum]HAP99915.1 hypothetical protein [Rhodospirillum rubrum]HCF18112.1 hypothetical protein [Rhodospirillum rubrum]
MWILGSRWPSLGGESVQLNDCFTKSDENYQTVWVVQQIVERTDGPPHARLVRQGEGAGSYRTISLSALRDTAFYRRVPPRPMPN